MTVADPFSLVKIDGTRGPLYLPSSFVRDQHEQLVKARKIAAGRVFSDYRHISVGMGPGLEKPTEGATFDLLRQLADVSPIDRLIIDTRIMQVKRVARRSRADVGPEAIGFAIRHERHNDPDFEVPEGIKKLCRTIEEIIGSPTAPFHTTARDFFASAVEEELTIDRKAMVIARDDRKRPVRIHLIDGATVRPVPFVVFEAIQRETLKTGNVGILSAEKYQETLYHLSELSGFDMTEAAYVQIVDGNIVGAWRDDEMSVDITNPSVRLNSWGYGRSLLEKSHRFSTAFLKAWNYNLELFNLNYPEAVLGVIGEYDEEGLRAFRRKVLGEGDGKDNNWRLPVIPMPDERSRLEMVKLRDNPKDMMFAEFLSAIIRLKCAAFRMHPSLINFESDQGSGVVFKSGDTEEQQIELSQEEGFHALLDSLGDWITRVIVKEWHEDLRFVWVGLDQEGEDALVQRAIQEGSYLSTNEIRKKRGHKKAPSEIPTDPADWIGGTWMQAAQAIQGQQMQQMQMGGQGYDQGDFGDGDDPQGGPPQRGGQPGEEQPDDQQQPFGRNPGAANATAGSGNDQRQRGGPAHLDEEAQELRRSRGETRPRRPRTLQIVIED